MLSTGAISLYLANLMYDFLYTEVVEHAGEGGWNLQRAGWERDTKMRHGARGRAQSCTCERMVPHFGQAMLCYGAERLQPALDNHSG